MGTGEGDFQSENPIQLIFHPKALEEFTSTRQWYESQQAGLGEKFAAEIVLFLNKIKEHPLLYPIFLNRVRQARLKRFKAYSIVYELFDDSIFVYSFSHGARDPKNLKDRLMR